MTADNHHLVTEALPSYEIGEELGRGAFGVVLRGRHRHLGRDVAIKQLPAVFSADPLVRSRFLAEAQVLASLTHPHVIPIYDYVEHGDVCVLVMEMLTGGTLWDRFTGQGLTPQDSCALMLALCAGLDHAHEHGVLHRDIKPENVLFAEDEMLKVADFGIAKVLTGAQAMATRAGDILGTPAYMAPEQAEGAEVGPQADIYASGIMLYELLSGKLPYSEEGGALAIVYRHVNEDPTPITTVAPTLPAPLAEVVMMTLERDPDSRFPTAEAFGVALGEAAATAWGPNWLERADVPVHASRSILSSTSRPSEGHAVARAGGSATAHGLTPGGAGATMAGAAPPPMAPPEAPGGADTGGNGAAGGGVPPPPPAPDAGSPPAAGDATPAAQGPGAVAAPVRPEVTSHVQGRGEEDLDPSDLIPVQEAIKRPKLPIVQLAASIAALLVAIGIAFAGPTPGWEEAPEAGTMEVAGVDPSSGAFPQLDLTEPFPVVLSPAAPAADHVEIELSFVDVPLSTTADAPLVEEEGARVAQVNLSGARFTAASTVTADVRLLAGDQETAAYRFGVHNVQQPFLTLPGALTIAVVLFALAYTESFLRHLRYGRRKVTGMMGVVITGGGIGAGLVGVAWLLANRHPVPLTAGVGIALGALAGLSAGMAALRAARRPRMLVRLNS